MSLHPRVQIVFDKFLENLSSYLFAACTTIVMWCTKVIVNKVDQFNGYGANISKLQDTRLIDSTVNADKIREHIQLISKLQESDVNHEKKVLELDKIIVRHETTIGFLSVHSILK